MANLGNVNGVLLFVCLICVIWGIEALDGESKEVASIDEERKRKRPFGGLMKPFATYTTLAGLFALKVKVIVVVITVLGILAIFFKMFIGLNFGRLFWPGLGGCDTHGVISGGGYVDHPPSSYHYAEYAPPPSHFAYDHDHSAPGDHDRHSSAGSASYHHRQRSPASSPDIKDSYLPRQRRQIARMDENTAHRIVRSIRDYDPGEEAVNKICKRRIVCEADVRARRSFVAAYSLYYFGSDGLARYRDRRLRPRTLAECARIYAGCKDPAAVFRFDRVAPPFK